MSVHLKVVDRDRLTKAISDSGFRIEHIAKKIGIVRQTLWAVATGAQERLLDAKALELCKLLEVDPTEVFALDTTADLTAFVCEQDRAEPAAGAQP